MAKVKELRDLPVQELLSRLETNKEELFALRFQFATGQLDNPMRIKQVRHDVARILTILRERQTEEELEESVAAADEESLEHGREMQAEGKVKGDKLEEMIETSAPMKGEQPVEESWEKLEEPPK